MMMRKRIFIVGLILTKGLSPYAQNNKPVEGFNTEVAPANLTAVKYGRDSVVLQWSASQNFKALSYTNKYIIYRSENGANEILNNNNILAIVNKEESKYVDKDIQPGSTYYYGITSVDKLHNETAPSNIAAVVDTELQVLLIDLKAATSDRQQVNLSWSMSSDVAANYFEIEKSINGKDFNLIAKMSANKGAAAKQFETSDVAGSAGTLFYRIKVMKSDGSFVYSPVAVVKLLNAAEIVKVYPNVLLRGEVLKVQNISTTNNRIDYVLMDHTGQNILKGTLTGNNGYRTIYETRQLLSGRYVLQVIQGNQHQVVQVMVQ
jgi:fibronectin type 3 domain-containing protein